MDKFVVSKVMGLCAVAVLAFAPGAFADVIQYELNSHPDGSAADPNDTNTWYGVRLDDPHTSATETFSFNEESADPMVLGNSTVSALLDTDTGVMTISGTIYHLQDSREAYGIEAEIQLGGAPFSAATVAELLAGNLSSNLTGDTISLVVTPLDGGTFQPLEWEGFDNQNGIQFMMGNNHRGVDGLSGWGWLAPTDPDYPHVASQDWLFTMDNPFIPPPPPIPEPATVALLGFGLAGVAVRMRKFKA